MDLVCVGDVMLDVHVVSGALARGGDVHGRVAIRPGGTSANAAVWAAWAGASAAVIAAVGDDLAGALCVGAVADRGVDVGGVVRRSSPTGVMVVMTEDGERSSVADRGANAQLRTADVEGIEAGAVLVSGYLLLQEPGHDVAVAAIGGVRTPLLAVEAASWPLLETFGVERFLEGTAACDVVLANEREARVLTGADGDDAARVLGARYRFAAAGRAVVGLGTSVIGQGLPFPQNLECVERMEAAIRGTGATPGWVGLVDGAVRVGLERAELARLAEPGAAVKVARRDVPVAVASGSLGATTVSATIWAAHRAGIGVAVTGGIGGVHPGPRRDVSADLLELGRTPIVLIASGPKSIADPAATAERLEELGVALVGYGVDRLPFFLAREAPVELEDRVETPEGAAAIAVAHRALGAQAAIVLCNPIATEHALD